MMDLKDIQKQREDFAAKAKPFTKAKNSNHNSYGAVISDTGNLVIIGKWVCHGWLSGSDFKDTLVRNNWKRGEKVAYILSYVMFPLVPKPELSAFVDWLINRSPWQKIFLDKDAERVLKLGHVVDASAPANFIASAMIASRFMTESYVDGLDKLHPVYRELLAMGCSENEAFLFSQMYTAKSASTTYPITFSRFSSGHATFCYHGVDKTYYKNFLQATPTKLEGDCRKLEGYGYNTVNAVWGQQVGRDTFGESLKQLKPISLTVAEDLHIFRKKPTTGFSYTNRADFKSVIDQLREMIYA